MSVDSVVGIFFLEKVGSAILAALGDENELSMLTALCLYYITKLSGSKSFSVICH